ncbi:putative repeat protein (TIGR03943 family) [Cohnella sp. SGD-V74]|uniref:TIGR03943 family putative permease subunit n=1 Tax=unclassified Cohnella TaxID=2636738 RepID=UPI000D4A26EC|nr:MULTISPECIES: TIGR03943 family protein [unclassified Cohnella]PRX61059.1 putative repeat protein (TIGR03943 family) [Cohnella sp. SGD-V74]
MPKSSAALAFHYLARAILLSGFALLIVHLVRSGNLNLYIAPRMQLIVKLSALGLYAVAAHQLYSAIRAFFDKDKHGGPDCDCMHEMPVTWGKSLLFYGWFALPLIIGYVVPDGLLGSSMASAKGVQFAPQTTVVSEPRTARSETVPTPPSVELPSPSASAPAAEPDPAEQGSAGTDATEQEATEQENRKPDAPVALDRELSPEELDLLFPSDNFTEAYAAYGKKLFLRDVVQVTPKRFIETLTTVDLYRDAFLGKTIEISGFVYRESGMGPQQFGISRFAVACCSADASPYGVMATFAGADELETDEWVSVTGTLGTTMYNDIEIIQIDIADFVRIPAPGDPYVSPDFDFGLEQLE